MNYYSSFADVYDILMSNVNYNRIAEYFIKIITRFEISGKLLLDLGCGTGTLCEIFSNFGYNVLGIDNSCEMLHYANQKKLQSGNDILYLNQDIIKFDLFGTVDIIVSTLDTLNHILKLNSLQQIFNRVSLFLDRNGVFIFDVNTVYKHKHILNKNIYLYDNSSVYCVWQNEYKKYSNIVDIDLDIFVKEHSESYNRLHEHISERAYTIRQLENLIKNAGLRIINIYDDNTFNPPRKESQRIIFVTRKV